MDIFIRSIMLGGVMMVALLALAAVVIPPIRSGVDTGSKAEDVKTVDSAVGSGKEVEKQDEEIDTGAGFDITPQR